MKKEDLVALGLNDEQINEVFKMRGKEIEETKVQISDLETAKLEAESQIEKMKEDYVDSADLNAIKLEKEGLESKIEELSKAHSSELEAIRNTHLLDSKLKEVGARDIGLVKTVLGDELEFKDGDIVGFDEAIKQAKESHDYLFGSKRDSSIITGKHKGGVDSGQDDDPFIKGFNSN